MKKNKVPKIVKDAWYIKILYQLEKIRLIKYILRNVGYYDCDIPLHKSEDTKFLVFLISLMSFLAVIAFGGVSALNNMTNRWSSGLENKVTIEISVETDDGHLLSNTTVQRETQKIAKGLKNNPVLKSLRILSGEEIQELISPWIGDGLQLTDIPLPGLIAIELKNTDEASLNTLQNELRELSEYANLETHKEWLADLIAFANTLRALSILIAFIISGATITAITAGIKTRLAIYKKEVELLHSIGASDSYIARQFQFHALLLAIKGSFVGTVLGLVTIFFISVLSNHSGSSMIPTIYLSFSSVTMLFLIPLIICVIASTSSRLAVLRKLVKMP